MKMTAFAHRRYMSQIVMLARCAKFVHSSRGVTMEAVGNAAYGVGSVALAGGIENFDLNFLPKNLTAQCHSLIVSYHELHGYACLPNILWKARLGHFIEAR
jgi:hypothetical protein